MKKLLFTLPILAFTGFLYWKSLGESKLCVGAKPLEGQGELAGVRGEKNKPLPDLTFTSERASFKERTVLLNLWATWCAPCKLEMPALEALQKQMGDKNFEVVAVNIDTRNVERAQEFYKEAKIENLKFYADSTAAIFQELKKANLAFGMPTTVLIDRQGCVVASLAGAAEWASQDALTLIKALKEQK